MDDPRFVGGGQAVGDLHRDVEQLADRRRAGQQQIAQRLAVDQLDGHVGDRVGRSHVVDRDDVGVRERRGRARFPLETLQPVRIGGQLRWEDLDGDVAAQTRIARPVNLSHPSSAERRKNLVRAETLSWGKSHGDLPEF